MLSEIRKKIKSLDELGQICRRLKKKGKKIVQCHGVFDLVHPGHLRHFQAARKEGDILVVTITKDRYVRKGPGRPIFNHHLRAETLASLEYVDYVAMVDSLTAVEAIKAIQPNVYVKGQDYEKREEDVTGKIYEEEYWVKKYGGRIHFTHEIAFSSSHLINNYLETYPEATINYLKKFVKKHTIEEVSEYFETTKNLKVLVIGDAIIDQYHYCEPMGKSSKEHIVVNRFIDQETFIGGILATANHVAEVSGSVDLLTMLGTRNSYEEFIRTHLNQKIKAHFFYREEAPTTVKRRYVTWDARTKLFEVCFFDDRYVEGQEEARILKYLEKRIKKYDLVVVNDFGHGLLSKRIIQCLVEKAKTLAINVQTNSANWGFNLVTKYPQTDFCCIDELELRLATHDKHSDVKKLLKKVQKTLKAKMVISTLGSQGGMSYQPGSGFEHCPALAYQVVDLVGAGDAFFSYTSPLFAIGAPQDVITFIGNAVGGLAVQIVCNREPVTLVDLMKFVTRLMKI